VTGGGASSSSGDAGEINLAREGGFALGALRVSPSTLEVQAAGRGEVIEPRVMQVLVCLAQAHGAVVSRDDLIKRCWSGRIVGDDAINRCIAKVRQIAALTEPAPFIIETIPRVGYRLRRTGPETPALRLDRPVDSQGDSRETPPAKIGRPARRWLWGVGTTGVLAAALLAGASLMRASDPPPSLRSVAILPVRNLSGDPSLGPIAEALTQDATDVAGRIGNILMPALTTSTAVNAQPLDVLAKGRRLHVRYLVTATLRRAAPGLRLSYRILDTADGKLLLASDFVDASPDLAVAEHRLALRLFYGTTNVIVARMNAYQLARPEDDHDPESIGSRLESLTEKLGPRDVPAAERLIAAAKAIPDTSDLKAALEIDACFAYHTMILGGYAASPQQRAAWAEDALDLGARAARLKPTASSPHECRVYTFIDVGRLDEAMAEARHNLESIPNSANAYEDMAQAEFARGQFRDALKDFIECAERHESGDPFHIGLTQLFLGDDRAALENLREFEVQSPDEPVGALFTAAALELSGRHQEAQAQAARYRQLKTDDTDWWLLNESRDPAFLPAAARIRAALHAVGLSEPTKVKL
jgi:DNA-binding winged helix-turn-helix (wHTH) protein/TolB-like protein